MSNNMAADNGSSKKRLWKYSYMPYKIILFVQDLLTSYIAFVLGLKVTAGVNVYQIENSNQHIALFLVSLIIIAFFPSYSLYSYHIIFSRKNHLFHLLKAFCWSLATFCIITFLIEWPYLFGENSLARSFFFLVLFIGLLLIEKYFRYQLSNILKAMGISCLVIGAIGLIIQNEQPLIWIYWYAMPIYFFVSLSFILIYRLFLVHTVFNRWLRRHFRRQIIIVGSDQEAEHIASHIIQHNAPFWIAGAIGVEENTDLGSEIPKTCLGRFEDLPTIVSENMIEEIVVTDEQINKQKLIALLDYCTSEGIVVWFVPRLLPIIDAKLYKDNFCGISMIRLCSQRNSWLFNKAKYAFDVLITLPALIMISPLLITIAIIIKKTSEGPVFYKAQAIGKDAKIFPMLKFRSMRVASSNESHKDFVTKLIKGEMKKDDGDDEEEKVFKIVDDPRITPIGKFIRKYSIDELPQLINVVKGDMSIVGPRPCLTYEYEIYKDWHKKRTCIRPGITGLWQVTGRSTVEFEDMILLDLYYIYNRSFLLDWNILYETVFVVINKQGAY